ncbi:MAG: TIGR03560 family F420-dependent LLM class oxidoreductase [Acidimicrobiia bacterium]|nr:TIGR03560 family F420-dependent LLM class oxidoreductase [Acidimicrobiia bacterium]
MSQTIRLPSQCLVVLIGPSGSGKTTWADANFRANQVVSSDRLRAAVGVSEFDQRASADAFAVLDEIVARRLKRKLLTVVDTLGINDDTRAGFVELARRNDLPVYAITFDTDAKVCRERNKQRARPVPAKVLTSQLASFERVQASLPEEGFDGVFEAGTIEIVTPAHLSAKDAADRQRENPMSLDFGLVVSHFDWPGGTEELAKRLADVAQRAERAGFTSLWVMDHFRQIPQIGREWEPMLESYTTLAYLAGRTEKIRLGALVTGIGYRNPAHLGKIIGTLDVLSGGRAMCGLGIGWFEKEATAYGWDWLPTSQRYDLLEDSVQIMRALWGKGAPAYQGKVHSVPEALSYPRPIQEHIPILIGGGGEKKTLRLAAKHADWCNLMGDPETVKHKLGVLADHCRDLDRDPTEIRASILTNLLIAADRAAVDQLVEQRRPESRSAHDFAREHNAGTVDDHIGRFREYAEAGVETVIVGMPDLGTGVGVEVFGEVINAFS